jgi:hypothetical protein
MSPSRIARALVLGAARFNVVTFPFRRMRSAGDDEAIAISPNVAAARVSAPAVNVRRSKALEEDALGSGLIGHFSSV